MAWLVVVLLVALSLLAAWVQVLQRDVIEMKAKLLKFDLQLLNNRFAQHNRRIEELEKQVRKLK